MSLKFNNGSGIKAVSSKPDSARSEALSLLIVDECVRSDTKIKIRHKKTKKIEEINIKKLFDDNSYK